MLKRVYRAFRQRSTRKQFLKKSVLGNNTIFKNCAKCINSGDKSNISIGNHAFIGAEMFALHGGKISIGNNVYIGSFTSLQSKEQISIGDNVIIANNVVIVDNNNHPTSPAERLKMSQCEDYINDELWSWKYAESKPIVIEENVWIGRDSRILKGVTIGRGSIVALGSIVTHSVPPYSVVAGNPAKVVKHLDPPEGEQ